MQDPPRLSFRQPMFTNVERGGLSRAARFRELLLGPGGAATPVPTVQHQLRVRRPVHRASPLATPLWTADRGPRPQARRSQRENCRASSACTITAATSTSAAARSPDQRRPAPGDEAPSRGVLRRRGWANELAKRGYVVLVHDTFTFGSRRMRLRRPARHHPTRPRGGEPRSRGRNQALQRLRRAARAPHRQEPLQRRDDLAGRVRLDDQRALDYLASRPDVDATRIGCAGLSGGGLRTVMLTGADERIRCSCCAGMMTTWRDYLLNKCYTHTWMCYMPGLPRDLDYPEILGLRCAESRAGAEQQAGSALHDAGDGTRRPDPDRGLHQGRRRDRYKAASTTGRTSSTATCRRRPSPGSIAGSRAERPNPNTTRILNDTRDANEALDRTELNRLVYPR